MRALERRRPGFLTRAAGWLAGEMRLSPYGWARVLLARGDVASRWWTPRVGDRVRLRGEGTWLVFEVRLRRAEVTLGRPGVQPLSEVEPADRADLDDLYDRAPGQRARWAEAIAARGKVVSLDDSQVFIVDGEVEE